MTPVLPRVARRADKLGSMPARSQLITLLVAWLLATGVQWDAIQVFGWGRMIVTSARTETLLAAVRQTFSPGEMCGVCCAVQDAKREQQDQAAAGMGGDKAPLVLQGVASVSVSVPPPQGTVPQDALPCHARREAPPVPPPRARTV